MSAHQYRSVFAITLVGLAYLPTHALADNTTAGYAAYADVIEVTPLTQIQRVNEPVELCTQERDDRYHASHRTDRDEQPPKHQLARSIIGSLVGGIIGHQFGGGHGKQALTAIGALAGASIAKRHRRDRRERDEHYYRRYDDGSGRERCRRSMRSRDITRTTGYQVRYRYNGETFTKVTQEHPGERIAVRVRISPAVPYKEDQENTHVSTHRERE